MHPLSGCLLLCCRTLQTWSLPLSLPVIPPLLFFSCYPPFCRHFVSRQPQMQPLICTGNESAPVTCLPSRLLCDKGSFCGVCRIKQPCAKCSIVRIFALLPPHTLFCCDFFCFAYTCTFLCKNIVRVFADACTQHTIYYTNSIVSVNYIFFMYLIYKFCEILLIRNAHKSPDTSTLP